jgi:response regulator NasT
LKEERALLKEDLETRKLIDRAKGILIDNYGLRESDAYRYIQKKAMTDRTTMKAIAESVLSNVSIFGNELHEESR